MRRLAPAAVLLLALAGCSWFNPVTRITPRSSLHSAPRRMSACGVSYSGQGALAAELPDGALIVGGTSRHGSKVVLNLKRVSPRCVVTDMPAVHLFSGPLGTIDALAATSDGGLIIAGSDGRHALVGKLLSDGTIDSSFALDGWTSLVPHERRMKGMPPPVFTATSIAIGPSGSIFVGGNDGGAHCCTRDFLSEVTPAGELVRTVLLRGLGSSYTTEILVHRDGSVDTLGEYEGSGCGGPSMIRIRPDGSLDKRFDMAIRRTIRTVMSKPSLRFMPTLLGQSNGRFLLVGGLDKTCVGAERGPLPSGGVVVPVSASGKIDGRVTRFASPNYAFDNPTVLRLASGRVLAAAFAYTPSGRLKDLLVESLPGGVSRIPLPQQARTAYPVVHVAILPRSGNSAWLVLGLPKEVDVTPIGVP